RTQRYPRIIRPCRRQEADPLTLRTSRSPARAVETRRSRKSAPRIRLPRTGPARGLAGSYSSHPLTPSADLFLLQETLPRLALSQQALSQQGSAAWRRGNVVALSPLDYIALLCVEPRFLAARLTATRAEALRL